jgi:RNA polymerase sigma-70 factor (ECF subfamily)
MSVRDFGPPGIGEQTPYEGEGLNTSGLDRESTPGSMREAQSLRDEIDEAFGDALFVPSERLPSYAKSAYAERPCAPDTELAPPAPAQSGPFVQLLLSELPRLRGAALFMTRSASDADDLLQQTALRALNAQHQFTLGTNIRAWLYRIMRNEFIDSTRQTKGRTALDDIPEDLLAGKGNQEDKIVAREVVAAMKTLSPVLLEVMLLVPGRGLSYQEAAEIQGCSVGTIKSRVSRARAKLHRLLMHDFRQKEAPES